MRTSSQAIVTLALAICCTTAGIAAEPMSTAFTYQGQLKKDRGPVNDTCDFHVGLWTADVGGTELGTQVEPAEVKNGLFTLKLNEAGQFGPDAFNGDARWLEIAVSCPAGSAFVPLGRQEITPAPYAHRAAAGAGDGSLWQLNVNGADIYYNDGNVGIGTTDPDALLDIEADQDTTEYIHLRGFDNDEPDVRPVMHFYRARGSADNPAIVANGDRVGSIIATPYDGSADRPAASVEFYVDGEPGDADMPSRIEFLTTPDGSASRQRRMVIKNDGNVGIGTPEPNANLEVSGDRLRLVDTSNAHLQIAHSGSNMWTWRAATDGDLDLNVSGYDGSAYGTSNRTAVTVRENGNVGIGTTNPLAKLAIGNVGSNDTTPILSMSEANSLEFFFESGFSGEGATGNHLKLKTGWDDAIAMSWRGDGNVGIGTMPDPSAKLNVAGHLKLSADGPRIFGGTGSVPVSIYGKTTSGNSRSWIEFWGDHAAGNRDGELALGGTYFTVRTNSNNSGNAGLERMRIDSNGNVGIGTSNPGNLLEIEGDDPDLGLDVPSGSPSHAEIRFKVDNTTKAEVSYKHDDQTLRLTNRSSGSPKTIVLDQYGNVGIGTPTPNGLLHLKGPSWTRLVVEAATDDPYLQLTSDGIWGQND